MAYHIVRNQVVPEITKINDRINKLEESIAGTDECVMDIYSLEEKLEDRLDHLEEEFQNKVDGLEDELASVKAENAELRNHLNSVVKDARIVSEKPSKRRRHELFKTGETQDGELLYSSISGPLERYEEK